MGPWIYVAQGINARMSANGSFGGAEGEIDARVACYENGISKPKEKFHA